MPMKTRDVMSKDVKTVTAETTVKEAAQLMTEGDVGALPVVDDAGKLVGMVTESDLIMQDVKVHFPTYFQLLDGFVYLGSISKFENQLKRAVAAKVGDVMATDLATVTADTDVEDVATMMVDRDVSRIPVLGDGKLVGIITKHDIVRAMSRG